MMLASLSIIYLFIYLCIFETKRVKKERRGILHHQVNDNEATSIGSCVARAFSHKDFHNFVRYWYAR